ncbi:4a-hydroxytetrahydrobiopterin dehydratase [Frateuria aurantia]
MTLNELARLHCQSQPRKAPLSSIEAQELLALLPGWNLAEGGRALNRRFDFPDFHRTLGFINAVGYIANQQDHHPDLQASYSFCELLWTTHDIGGLSLNDFICAARCQALIDGWI